MQKGHHQILALDGGHVAFLMYEIVVGRPAPEKFMEFAQVVGDRSNLSSRILWNLFFCSLVEHRMKFWILLELFSINVSVE